MQVWLSAGRYLAVLKRCRLKTLDHEIRWGPAQQRWAQKGHCSVEDCRARCCSSAKVDTALMSPRYGYSHSEYHGRSRDFVAQFAHRIRSCLGGETAAVKSGAVQSAAAVSPPSCQASAPFPGSDSRGTSQNLPSAREAFAPCTRIFVHGAYTNHTKVGLGHISPKNSRKKRRSC